MRNFKKFGVLAIAVLALSAIGAANASAAEFTASATGELTGTALANQVLGTNGGNVTCTTAAPSGTIAKTADTQQHMTIKYSGCTGFGFATVNYSNMTVRFTSNGQAHIENTITITPTFFSTSVCTVTITPQTAGGVAYSNSGPGRVRITFQITGIAYHSTGSSCGAAGTNGTLTGSLEVSRVGGGELVYDA